MKFKAQSTFFYQEIEDIKKKLGDNLITDTEERIYKQLARKIILDMSFFQLRKFFQFYKEGIIKSYLLKAYNYLNERLIKTL